MKNIVIDFSDLDTQCGFGEIARNYAPHIAALNTDDLHFIFIVPRNHLGEYGSHIDYLTRENLRTDLHHYKQPIHLWHATHQQFRYRHHAKETLQLLTIHDLNYLYEKNGIHKLRHIVQTYFRIRHSHYVSTISHFVKQEIERHVWGIKETPTVIYNGIANMDNLPQQKPAFIDQAETPFFFSLGQVRLKKNLHTLIPMMQHLPSYKLYICGDDHFPYAQFLRTIIKAADRNRIVITGKINEAEKRWLYSHCQAFLFPSRLEGFGLPVLEAMRFGAKVFSSRSTCMPEICGPHATYWNSYNPKVMAKVVQDGIKDWVRDGKAANLARQYSLTFNYDKYTSEYLALYRRLLNLDTGKGNN